MIPETVRSTAASIQHSALPVSASALYNNNGYGTQKFLDETLWPEFKELNTTLRAYLEDITNRVVSEGVHADSSEAWYPIPKSNYSDLNLRVPLKIHFGLQAIFFPSGLRHEKP